MAADALILFHGPSSEARSRAPPPRGQGRPGRCTPGYQAVPRGRDTFVPLADFDYDASRRKRGSRRAIAEVVVDYTVPDVQDLMLRVERWVDGVPSTITWQPRACERHRPGRLGRRQER